MIKSKLKVKDIVILKPDSAHLLYDGVQMNKEQYKQIHQENIQGKITRLWEVNSHYARGKFAAVTWDNKTKTDTIHISWLKKVK